MGVNLDLGTMFGPRNVVLYMVYIEGKLKVNLVFGTMGTIFWWNERGIGKDKNGNWEKYTCTSRSSWDQKMLSTESSTTCARRKLRG